jgi:hypothetical protein
MDLSTSGTPARGAGLLGSALVRHPHPTASDASSAPGLDIHRMCEVIGTYDNEE